MVRELADRVITLAIRPTSLLRSESFDRDVAGTNQSFSLCVVRSCSSSTPRKSLGFLSCA